MIRKYNHHILKTPGTVHNNHRTPVKQTKQSNQLSLSHDCKTRMDIKEHKTKHRTITHSQNESTNQQQIKTTEQPP